MNKRFVSLVLAMVMLFTLSSPAFAIDLTSDPSEESTHADAKFYNTTVLLDGELTPIKCYVENNAVTYAEIGEDIMQCIDGKVYWNGTLVATITSEIVMEAAPYSADVIMPRTGWLYNDSCPNGFTSSDFSRLFATKNHNITFEETIGSISVNIILAILLAAFPFDDAVGGQAVFQGVAEKVFEEIIDYAMTPKVYAREDIFSLPNMGYIHKNAFNFYSDSAHTKWIGYSLAYSSWC